MDEGKKEGVSVKEIETFTKNHRFEVFFCLLFVLACFFSFVMWGTGWAVVLAAIGGVLGVLASAKIGGISYKIFQFVFRQEKTTQLVLAVVGLILAIFIPPLIFLWVGLHGGKELHKIASDLGRGSPR